MEALIIYLVLAWLRVASLDDEQRGPLEARANDSGLIISLDDARTPRTKEEVEVEARAEALKTEADALAARAQSGCSACSEQANAKYLEAAELGNDAAGVMWSYRCWSKDPTFGFPNGCDAAKALSFFETACIRAPHLTTAMYGAIKAGEGNFKGVGIEANASRGCEFVQAGMSMLRSFISGQRLQGADADKAAAAVVGSNDTLASLYFNHAGCVYRGKHQRLANPAERATARIWALRAGIVAPQMPLPPLREAFGPLGEPTHVGTISWEGAASGNALYAEAWFLYLWLGHDQGQWYGYCKRLGLLGLEHVRVKSRAAENIVLITEDGSTELKGVLDPDHSIRGTVVQRDGTRGQAMFLAPEAIRTDYLTDYAAIAQKRGTSTHLESGGSTLLQPRILEQNCNLRTEENCNTEHLQALELFRGLGSTELRALRADFHEDARQGCPITPKLAARCTWDAWEAQHRVFVLEHLLAEMEPKEALMTEL